MSEKVLWGGGGGIPIVGHTRDVQSEWEIFGEQKLVGWFEFLFENSRMRCNFDIEKLWIARSQKRLFLINIE